MTKQKNKKGIPEAVRAYNYVCRLLTCRDYTVHEIRTKLKQKRYDENVSEDTISKFIELGFLDDCKYVGKYVRSRINIKPRSQYLLGIELRKKGINEVLIENYFSEEPLDELTEARRLIDSKMRSILKVPQEKRREKIAYYLSSRGFSLRFIDFFVQKV